MSSAGISFGGLASGLDTRAIISALVAVERRPITALETKKRQLGKQKDLFGDLGELLKELQDTAKKLARTTDLLSMKATSDDEDRIVARASSSATPGSHRVVVHALATSQVNASQGRADKDATSFGASTLLLTVDGVAHAVEIGADSTLQGIANAINDQDLDVAADVIDTGQTGNNRYQLVLRSTVTGSDGAFTLELDSGPASMQALVDEISTNSLTAASDAHITLNGAHIYRPSNSIADGIPGVTLDLLAADVAKTITVTVSTNAEETAETVNKFVEAYNKLVDFMADQNKLDANGQAQSPLFGDVTLRGVRSNLRSIVGGSVATGNSAFSLMSQIGITSDRDGKLTFDRTKFEAGLVEDEQAVATLFSAANTGIAARVQSQIDVYTDAVDGLLKARSDGFDRMLKDAQRRIDQGEERLERFEKALEQRYANLEQLLARLQGQGSGLQSLQSLPSLTRR